MNQKGAHEAEKLWMDIDPKEVPNEHIQSFKRGMDARVEDRNGNKGQNPIQAKDGIWLMKNGSATIPEF